MNMIVTILQFMPVIVLFVLVLYEIYVKPEMRVYLSKEKILPNEKCTMETKGILRKWKIGMETSRHYSNLSTGRVIIIGIVYYFDEDGNEYYIDILENRLINRKTVPSGSKLTVYYNPESPDEAYIQLEDRRVTIANKIFKNKLMKEISLILVAGICFYRILEVCDKWIKSQGNIRANEINQFLNIWIAIFAVIVGIIYIVYDQLRYDMLQLDYESRCTTRTYGIIERWSQHKVPISDERESNIVYLAEVSFQDENGNTHLVDVAEKSRFNHNRLNERMQIPICVNPNNKFDACIDYAQLVEDVPIILND